MGIYDNINTLDPAGKAASVAKQNMGSSMRSFTAHTLSHFKSIWERGDGMTPQQFLDGLNGDAADFVTDIEARRAFILQRNPALDSNFCQPPKEYTKNPDGTVTVIEPEAQQ